ncbi:hypothetical protein J6590_067107 [Homalodisca vitripennis]|nr:hypothetical protein J6590_067107 [Homalodisca vitripennis]
MWINLRQKAWCAEEETLTVNPKGGGGDAAVIERHVDKPSARGFACRGGNTNKALRAEEETLTVNPKGEGGDAAVIERHVDKPSARGFACRGGNTNSESKRGSMWINLRQEALRAEEGTLTVNPKGGGGEAAVIERWCWLALKNFNSLPDKVTAPYRGQGERPPEDIPKLLTRETYKTNSSHRFDISYTHTTKEGCLVYLAAIQCSLYENVFKFQVNSPNSTLALHQPLPS